MGFDIERFVNLDLESVGDFICPVCTLILEDPIYTECEHMFCTQCINLWMGSAQTCRCPVCNETISNDELKNIPRVARNMLNNLSIRCENLPYGCDVVCKLESLPLHLSRCAFRNERIEPSAPLEPSCISLAMADSCINQTSQSLTSTESTSFSCRDCLRSSLISCGQAIKYTIITFLYMIPLAFFTSCIVFGVTQRNNCDVYPTIPTAQTVVGVFGIISTFSYILKHHTNNFKNNKCRIISLAVFTVIVAEAYLAFLIYGHVLPNAKDKDFNGLGCDTVLLWFSFVSLNTLIVLCTLYCFLITLKRCCIFLFE